MKKISLLLIIGAFISCSDTKVHVTEEMDDIVEQKRAEVILQSLPEGKMVGKVIFEERNDSVLMKAKVNDILPNGFHAFHIHENGDCSSTDGKSAGGHWNPTNEDHGMWNSEKHHRGDIGNIITDSSGVGELAIITDKWCIGCKDTTKNILGKAIIIHEGGDDFRSQPSGDAGPRVACGEIIRVE